MASTGLISLDTLKQVRVINVLQDVNCNASDPCYAMSFTLSTLLFTSIQNITKNEKLRNKMERGTEYPTVQYKIIESIYFPTL